MNRSVDLSKRVQTDAGLDTKARCVLPWLSTTRTKMKILTASSVPYGNSARDIPRSHRETMGDTYPVSCWNFGKGISSWTLLTAASTQNDEFIAESAGDSDEGAKSACPRDVREVHRPDRVWAARPFDSAANMGRCGVPAWAWTCSACDQSPPNTSAASSPPSG